MKVLEPVSINKDSRRTLKNLLRTDIKDINVYEAKKGCTLGNHYHKHTIEYFYITRGTCIVRTGTNVEIVNKGTLFVVKPNTTHSIECLTDASFLTFLTEPYNSDEPDLYK